MVALQAPASGIEAEDQCNLIANVPTMIQPLRIMTTTAVMSENLHDVSSTELYRLHSRSYSVTTVREYRLATTKGTVFTRLSARVIHPTQRWITLSFSWPMPVNNVTTLALPVSAFSIGVHAKAINPVRIVIGGDP